MKIAILFSGRINKYDKHYDNIMKCIVQHHEADFFLSHNSQLNENVDDFEIIYKPKTVNRQLYPYIQEYSSLNLHPLTNMNNFMSMWFHRKIVFENMMEYMKTTNTKYDLYIQLRLDAFSEEILNIEDIINNACNNIEKNKGFTVNRDCKDEFIFTNTVFVPDNCHWGGLNDQMAFGNFETMQKYMLLFNDIWTLMKEQPQFGPETILLGHLIKNDVNIHYFPFKYKLINGKMFH
jgi:hypothetical protein